MTDGARRTVLLVLLVAFLPLLFVYQPRLNHDVALFLTAANSFLEGRRPIVDLVDVNPPLMIYLDLVPADFEKRSIRIVTFDAAGGWNIEEEGYQAVGSGSIFAKSSMKKLYSQVTDADSALRVAVEALYDAADDDSATGGPDLVRGIYPTAVTIGAEGAADVPESRIAELAREVIESRSRADTFGPDGEPRGEK